MNFILENTFLWEVDWRPLIKFHCLITTQGHYGVLRGAVGAPLQQAFKGSFRGHANLAGHIKSLQYLGMFQKWKTTAFKCSASNVCALIKEVSCVGNVQIIACLKKH